MMGFPDVWFGSFDIQQMFGMVGMMGIPNVWSGK